MIHVLNVEINLFEVLFVQNELFIVKTENMLGREDYFGEAVLEADESVAADFYVLFINAKVKTSLLAAELGYFE